jgi:biogenesis of lysosome-related organelles complex 1 subunit KXD1
MATSSYYQYQVRPSGTLPVNVPEKQGHPQYARHNRLSSGYGQYSVSPPEAPESVTTSGAGLYSSASSQYASSEYDSSSSGGATSIDLLDYMNDRLSQTYNPIPLDLNMVKQAKM